MSEICSEAKRAANESRKCVCTERNKTNKNCSDKCKNTMPDKELINNNDVAESNENSNIIENVISESTDEFVECDYEMLRCIDEEEREWKNNIVVKCGQRVNFPINFSEPECSQMYILSLIHI